jgi:hypothetical protein
MDRKRALVAVIATALAAMAVLFVLAMPAVSVRAKRLQQSAGILYVAPTPPPAPIRPHLTTGINRGPVA